MKYTFIIYGTIDTSPFTQFIEDVNQNLEEFGSDIRLNKTVKLADYSLKSKRHLDEIELKNIKNMIKSKFSEKFMNVSVELTQIYE